MTKAKKINILPKNYARRELIAIIAELIGKKGVKKTLLSIFCFKFLSSVSKEYFEIL